MLLESWENRQGKDGIGPSSYWIKGFVILDTKEIKNFKQEYQWNSMGLNWKPTLEPGFLQITSPNWSFSKDFNNYIKTASYIGKFYLDLNNGVIYFDVER